jgi:tetratricopeptide (TPR) repeat protein
LVRLQLAYAHMANQDLDASEVLYVGMLERNPDAPQALLGLARIAGMRGNVDDALAYIGRLRALGARESDLRKEEVAIFSMSGQTDRAVERVGAWLKESPEDPQALLARAVLAIERKEKDLIPDLMEKVRASKSMSATDRLVLAQLLIRFGNHPEARRQLDKVLEQPQHQIQALQLLLNACVAERDVKEARDTVRRILSLDPEHPYANYVLGTLQYADRQLREAASSFQTSIRREPTADALNSLAYVLHELGRDTEALPLVRQALELKTEDPAILDTLAAILLGLDRPAEALEVQRRALVRHPDYPPFLLTLGRIHHALGQKVELRQILGRLMEFQADLTAEQRLSVQELSGQSSLLP